MPAIHSRLAQVQVRRYPVIDPQLGQLERLLASAQCAQCQVQQLIVGHHIEGLAFDDQDRMLIAESGYRGGGNAKVSRIEDTMQGFDAAFLAVGAHIAKRAFIPAKDGSRILDAVQVLRPLRQDERRHPRSRRTPHMQFGRIYEEIKQRPLYVVRERVGLGAGKDATTSGNGSRAGAVSHIEA